MGRAAFIAGGLMLVHFLPSFFNLEPVQAAWAWSAGAPMCKATTGWVFADGSSTIAAGVSAEMNCTHTGTKETVMCPSSTGTGGTSGDPDWWGPCGFGDSCAVQLEINGTSACATQDVDAANTLGLTVATLGAPVVALLAA